MLWDMHMHTHFSGDSTADPESMVKEAIRLGLPGICFTDHLDWDYPEDIDFDLDMPTYQRCIADLKDRYKDRITILFGVELGIQPHLSDRLTELTQAYPFDFIIGSSHLVHNKDPYYPAFYEGRPEKEAYHEYFESILENLNLPFTDYDSYGHIDYTVRYGPNKNQFYTYEAYADILDAILEALIRKEIALEVNTAGFKYGLGHPNPTEDVIRRYHQLGGRLLTIGADGHKPEHIAYDFDKIPALLKDCGFDSYTIYRQRKPEFLPL